MLINLVLDVPSIPAFALPEAGNASLRQFDGEAGCNSYV